MLAGHPVTPVPRIVGAVFRGAKDTDIVTSGCPWVLTNDGSVIRVEKEELRAGMYELLNRCLPALLVSFHLRRIVDCRMLTARL